MIGKLMKSVTILFFIIAIIIGVILYSLSKTLFVLAVIMFIIAIGMLLMTAEYEYIEIDEDDE